MARGIASPSGDPFAGAALAKRARALLRAVATGGAAAARRSFAADTVTAADRARAQFAALRRGHGAFAAARVVGSQPTKQATILTLQFGKVERTWRATWSKRRKHWVFSNLEPVSGKAPHLTELSWRQGRDFHALSSDGLEHLRLRLVGRKLLWNDRSNPVGAELVCRRR